MQTTHYDDHSLPSSVCHPGRKGNEHVPDLKLLHQNGAKSKATKDLNQFLKHFSIIKIDNYRADPATNNLNPNTANIAHQLH